MKVSLPLPIQPVTGQSRRLTVAADLRRVGVPSHDGSEALHTALHKGRIFLDYAMLPGVLNVLQAHQVPLRQRDECTGTLLPGTPVWSDRFPGIGVVHYATSSGPQDPITYQVHVQPYGNANTQPFQDDCLNVSVFLSAAAYDKHKYPKLQPPEKVAEVKKPTRFLLFNPITSKAVQRVILLKTVESDWSFGGSLRDYLERGILPCPENHVPAVSSLLKQYAHPVTDVR